MKAVLSISDRGFLFGEGIFRTLKVSDGNVLYWQDHLQKLQEDCQFLSLPCPTVSKEAVQQLIHENQASTHTWRLKIICTQSLLMTLDPYSFLKKEKRLTLFPQCIERPSAKVKSLSYLDNLLVSKYSKERGYDDALILNHEKAILECSKANFLWMHKETLHFTDPGLPYYEGVMQDLCMRAALLLGMKVKPCRQQIAGIPLDAHLFTSNAMQGIIPVTQIDQRIFTRNLQLEKEFRQTLNSL